MEMGKDVRDANSWWDGLTGKEKAEIFFTSRHILDKRDRLEEFIGRMDDMQKEIARLSSSIAEMSAWVHTYYNLD